MRRILLIEDDKDYAQILMQILSDAGYDVTHTAESTEGLNIGKEQAFDLVICDLYLGKLTGSQVIEMIKMYRPETKSLIISNSGDTDDELKSLRVGADDFVRKDSPFEVILARVKNAMDKKILKTNFQVIKSEAENIEIDQVNRIVKKDGKLIHLTNIEFDLLVFMLQNKSNLLSREMLIEKVWKVPSDSATIDIRTVDAHVKNLRAKLKLSSIFSVRGVGYRWYE